MAQNVTVKIPPPRYRYLQVYAFDPSFDWGLDTAVINKLKLAVPWEDDLLLGPLGEYLEVVDVDPASNMFYPPVNLDHKHLLVQDGMPPSEGTPQFHQQMVYAVAMRTIMNFEAALGRKVLWASHIDESNKEKFVRRLRIYPHALRQANAYYSPNKKSLLFGYFPASTKEAGRNLPGGMVFTCLAHDIVTHETTHALMDGLHPFFGEPSNPDVLALHEAFADIVALFQRFSYPEVLSREIAKTRGDLASGERLAGLARQFGEATGKRGALRSAIAEKPDMKALQQTYEPHKRGSILVAAIFDAFLTVYEARIADLLRIASGGTGILQEGAIHPDLVNRMAEEAARISQHVLTMCIRALDYCPPVDVTFGEYIRAIVTADVDMNPDDQEYRIAMIESFRKRGIYPAYVRNLSQESLIWHPPEAEHNEILATIFDEEFMQKKVLSLAKIQEQDRYKIFSSNILLRKIIKERLLDAIALQENICRYKDGKFIKNEDILKTLQEGLNLTLKRDPEDPKYSIYSYKQKFEAEGLQELSQEQQKLADLNEFDINSVRFARRVDQHRQPHTHLVVEISQCRRGYLDPKDQAQVDSGEKEPEEHDFMFRGGATMLIDVDTGSVHYVIYKNVGSDRRLDIQRRYLREPDPHLAYTYMGNTRLNAFQVDGERREPFALLHGDPVLED
jgi:hypothetical protein